MSSSQSLTGEICVSTKIYFLRHGESEANVRGVLCGSGRDAELTERGKAQISFLASQVHSLKIKTLVASPLARARSSADLLGLDYQVDAALKEQFYGDWEGLPFEEVREKFLKHFDPPNGESHLEFLKRITDAFVRILKLEGPVLIVSHGGVGSELLSYLGHQKRLLHNAELYLLT